MILSADMIFDYRGTVQSQRNVHKVLKVTKKIEIYHSYRINNHGHGGETDLVNFCFQEMEMNENL